MNTIKTIQSRGNSGIAGAKAAIPTFKLNNRITGYKYDPKQVKEYKPNKPLFSQLEANSIAEAIQYVHVLSMLGMYEFENNSQKHSFFGDAFSRLPDDLEAEPKYANNELNLCFYSSSLMYLMLREEPAIDKKCLKYVQGFLRTKPSEDYRTPDGAAPHWMYTSHAFLVYKDVVLDTTIMQIEKYIMSELEHTIIFGDVGYLRDIFTYFGFEEHPQTAMKFAKRFAKISNMAFHEWLLKHRANAKLLPNLVSEGSRASFW